MLTIRTKADRTRYARSGTLRIGYELCGTRYRGRPRLVLIQGMGFDRTGWKPVLPELRRQFRLVLVDNRGIGRSDQAAGSYDIADMAGDVVAVLDAAGVGRTHVLGASLGGMVAQELAITHPERVDRLVLACTTPGWPSGYPMPAASVRLMTAARGMTSEVALRRHTENALSARTVQDQPELVNRSSSSSAPGRRTREPCRPRRPQGPGTPGTDGRRASRPARWSCTAAATPWSTRVTAGCSPTASLMPGS
jgi:pimeloyl-ACP methyl ester carboxylesterase